MFKRLIQTVALAAVVATPLDGCKGRTSLPTARVAGQVTIGGKPLAEGWILFVPQAGHLANGVKATIKDGRFVAANVPKGKVLVMFNAMQPTGRMVTTASSSKAIPETIDLLPEKYHSGIALEITGDKADQEFRL
jgi:hypothetical protein